MPQNESTPADQLSFFARLTRPGFEPSWRHAIALAILVLVVFATISSGSTLFDRDEPRFAQASVEMLETGNYLYPTFNGNLRADKPIFIYWLMIMSLQVLGHVELAVRIWSCLGVAGSTLLTYWMGKRLASPWVGLVAAAMITTTPILTYIGTASTADGVLFFFCTMAMAVFVRVITDPELKVRWHDYLLLTLALAGAQLTKGPVGLGIPALGIIGVIIASKKMGQATPRVWPLLVVAVVGSTAAFLAWAIPANQATGGEFLKLGVGKHVVARAAKPMEGHGGNYLLYMPFYIGVLIVGFFPWTLLGIATVRMTWRGTIGSAKLKALCVGWALPTLILMTLVATKLPHYILPIWPALALLSAAALERFRSHETEPEERLWAHRGGVLFAPVGIGIALVLLIAPWTPFLPAITAFRIAGGAMGVLILLVVTLTLTRHLKWHFLQACAILWAGVVVVQLGLGVLLLPSIEPLKLGPQVARIVKNAGTETTPVATMDFQEPSLDFYVNRPPLKRVGPADYPTWASDPGSGIMVLTRAALEEINPPKSERISEVGSVPGINHTKGKPMEVVVLFKAARVGSEE